MQVGLAATPLLPRILLSFPSLLSRAAAPLLFCLPFLFLFCSCVSSSSSGSGAVPVSPSLLVPPRPPSLHALLFRCLWLFPSTPCCTLSLSASAVWLWAIILRSAAPFAPILLPIPPPTMPPTICATLKTLPTGLMNLKWFSDLSLSLLFPFSWGLEFFSCMCYTCFKSCVPIFFSIPILFGLVSQVLVVRNDLKMGKGKVAAQSRFEFFFNFCNVFLQELQQFNHETTRSSLSHLGRH